MKSCCFSGHRAIPPARLSLLKLELDVTLRRLIADGVSQFYCGAARGFDTLAAQAVLSLKKTYPFIRLHLLLPCRNQSDFWCEEDKAAFRALLQAADSVTCLQEYYTKSCMYERNKALVDAADCLVCYLTEKKSGTAYTVSLAVKQQKPVIALGLSESEKAAFEETFLSPQLAIFDDTFDV